MLSFGTHPDDIEIGCGGTEALLAQKGYEITHVILTSGEAGSDSIPPWELGAIREREAIEAAKDTRRRSAWSSCDTPTVLRGSPGR